MEWVCICDNYFLQKLDACGLPGLSSHQKITAALRILCYGMYADATDKYYRTSKSMAMESLKKFCVAIRNLGLSLRHTIYASLHERILIGN